MLLWNIANTFELEMDSDDWLTIEALLQNGYDIWNTYIF